MIREQQWGRADDCDVMWRHSDCEHSLGSRGPQLAFQSQITAALAQPQLFLRDIDNALSDIMDKVVFYLHFPAFLECCSGERASCWSSSFSERGNTVVS